MVVTRKTASHFRREVSADLVLNTPIIVNITTMLQTVPDVQYSKVHGARCW
jgi:zona occludens toxin (predicted ATPase)